ncbi:MAG: hypothetical protein ACNI3A_12695 [Desulfovibrio sp.]|uniref:hypothetical protein n=1 Tax=Desulfovibrio sp. 7SRBS1 TaxID=3378064 RepID=UPI003B3D03D6
MRSVFFWAVATISAIWGQTFLPGVDLLAPLFLVSLQEEKAAVNFWLCLIWVLIQEGTGSLAFGSGLLFYAALALLFWVGRWMFEAKNFLFVCILAVLSGLLHGGVTWVMATLEDVTIAPQWLLTTSLRQILCFILVWLLVARLYASRVKAHANTLSN